MSESPDLIQPVIGFRAWQLGVIQDIDIAEHYGVDLLSAGAGQMIWRPGKNTAKCRGYDKTRGAALPPPGERIETKPHFAPTPDCGCGLYAYHEIHRLHGGIVFGAVAAWGKMEIHRVGFRAEHARIVALGLSDRFFLNTEPMSLVPLLRATARRYGVPLVSIPDLEDEAYKHGIKVPDVLLPEKKEEEVLPISPAFQLSSGASGGVLGGSIMHLGNVGSISGGRVSVLLSGQMRDSPKPTPGLGAWITTWLLLTTSLYALISLTVGWSIWTVIPWMIFCALTPGFASPRLWRFGRMLRCTLPLVIGDRAGGVGSPAESRCARCGWRHRKPKTQ